MRPECVVLVAGTSTGVGKTWVAARLAESWRAAGHRVSARKPVQSFDGVDGATDADVLAAATGEAPTEVCPAERWYEAPMAPPIAAEALARPAFTMAEVMAGLRWPPASAVRYGLVEAVGGPRSPLASDADTVTLAEALRPDRLVLVSDAGLGAINAVRLASAALAAHAPLAFLNRFDGSDPVHAGNLTWLRRHTDLAVHTSISALQAALELNDR